MTHDRRGTGFLAPLALWCAVGCTFNHGSLPLPGGGGGPDVGPVPIFDGGIPERSFIGPDGGRGVCLGLQCQQTGCTSGGCRVPKCSGTDKTTVTGVVRDPAGKVPLFNVTVYVPNSPLADLSQGATCDCETSISGSPVVSATTNSKGEFTLEDVPVGSNIPLVIQVGKWRRQATLPSVAACTSTAADATLTRLPRNQSEGHIPKIALTTGGLDALECLLRKIGLEDGEFTPETGVGRVNLFAGGKHMGLAIANNSAGSDAYDPSRNGGAMFTDAETWWESGANLNKYDMILHSCEGLENPSNKSLNARAAMQAYADAGGRVFASHWHNYWIEHGPAPWPTVATFNHQKDPASPFTATIDTTFPKGMAMAEWLTNVGGSMNPGELIIQGAKRTVQAVNTAQRWIYSPMPQSVQYFSFNTPVATDKQCGKVVFSDLHVSAGSGGATNDSSAPGKPFPTGCVTTELSAQEKALEFMLFDLSTCVHEPVIIR